MYGLDPRASTRRIDELIETFEMGDYVDDLSENYSHGMKQRVVFASALVHDPKVLIVDEPLVGLDPRSARIVKDLFLAQARSGVAVLMSTHLLSIAEELADTIGIVDHGRMLAHGTLAELRDRVQMHGPLEDLFLKLTGGDRPLVDGAFELVESRDARAMTSTRTLPHRASNLTSPRSRLRSAFRLGSAGPAGLSNGLRAILSPGRGSGWR